MQNGFEGWNQMLPPEKMQMEEKLYWSDIEYMLSILPAMIREIWLVCEAILDQYEYEGSVMYVQYPDQVTINRIADQVYERVRYLETQESRGDRDNRDNREKGNLFPLVLGTLLANMTHRRQRYWRRKRVKYESINQGNQRLFE